MPEKIKRFGVGLLPMHRSGEGRKNEALSNNAVGLFGTISESSNKLVSYSYNSRLKQNVDAFKTKLIVSGSIGKIAKIDVADEPVVTLTNQTAVGTPNLVVHNGKVAFVRFLVDVDLIDNATGNVLTTPPTVTLFYTVAVNNGSSTKKTYKVEGVPDAILDEKIVPNYTGFESGSTHALTFDSVKVTLPTGINASDVTIALNNILIAYKEA